jgi:hypothetical protein
MDHGPPCLHDQLLYLPMPGLVGHLHSAATDSADPVPQPVQIALDPIHTDAKSPRRAPQNAFCILKALVLFCAQMMEHHLLQSTVQGAIDHILERHPGNPNPKKAPKRRRLRKKSDNPKDFAELAQVRAASL